MRLCLEASCAELACTAFARDLLALLNTPHYTRDASVMPLPATYAEWAAGHRTARKRAARAARLGYRFSEIERAFYADDIWAINRSMPERQGRPMSAGYLERQEFGLLPDYPCPRHRIATYGVLEDEELRAYLVLYRSGKLAVISQILGHGDHLAGDIMYLLAAGVVAAQVPLGGALYYNRHDSGTDGLRYFKERLGFRPDNLLLAA